MQATKYGETALDWAVFHQNEELLGLEWKEEVQNKAQCFDQELGLGEQLASAANSGHLAILRYLVKRAEEDESSQALLPNGMPAYASVISSVLTTIVAQNRHDQTNVMQALLNSKVGPDHHSVDLTDCIGIAVRQNSVEALKLLLRRYPDPLDLLLFNLKDDEKASEVCYWMSHAIQMGHSYVVEELLRWLVNHPPRIIWQACIAFVFRHSHNCVADYEMVSFTFFFFASLSLAWVCCNPRKRD